MRFFLPITLLYFIVLGVEIYAETLNDIHMVWFTKPLLMPILLVLFLLNAKNNPSKERLFFIGALTFSLAGDVFLMFRREDLFVFGLASFLIGHIAYILSFNGRIKAANVSMIQKVFTSLPFLVFVLAFLWILYPYIMAKPETEPLFGPVSVYASVIALMGFTSFLRKKGVTDFGFWAVFGGAVLFMISDSCIAINKFIMDEQMPYKGLVIMSTYGIAQYLMTIGTLKSGLGPARPDYSPK
jgi:uncharacterized membrane protein YhhN